MNKQELLKALENYPDNAEIVIWKWTETGSKYYYTNQTCTNNTDRHPDRFELIQAYEIKPTPTN